MTKRHKPLSGAEMLRTAFGKMSHWFWTSLDSFVTVLCQIWTQFRLVSELPESQQNRPVGKARSVSGMGCLAGEVEVLKESYTILMIVYMTRMKLFLA